MGAKYVNLTGQKFGRLNVVSRIKHNGKAYWLCKCDCGGEKVVDTYRLKSGHTRSCGCLEQENREKRKSCDEYIGKKYAHLTIISEVPTKANELRKVICRCDCGTEKIYYLGNVLVGHTQSCGCFHKEYLREKQTVHCDSKSRLYEVWLNIKRRCYSEKCNCYKNYGGRGIKVCPEWHDFTIFKEWAITHGYAEDAEFMQCTLDRIDVNGDYCPENCRWVNALQQGNNKRNNRWITFEGETHTVSQWARIKNINYTTLFSRLFYHGWSIKEALTISPKIGGKRQ